MEDKKDIGTLIKSRLSDSQIPPEEGLWERIEGSLEARDRRKRNIMLLWISGGAAAVLLFLLLLNVMGSSNSETEGSMESEDLLVTQVDSILNNSEVNSEKTITYKQLESLVADSLQTGIRLRSDSLETTPEKNGESPDTSMGQGDTKKNGGYMEEGVTIKTVYHYYNSTTKEVFETTDKEVIDSLIDNGNKETDSVQVIKTRAHTMKKKDSLG